MHALRWNHLKIEASNIVTIYMFIINECIVCLPSSSRNSNDFKAVNFMDDLQNNIHQVARSEIEQRNDLHGSDNFDDHCSLIHEPICQGLEYSHTRFPNAVGLTAQNEAAKRMEDYRALARIGCSKYLKFFLCTVYFPLCAPTPSGSRSLQPCRTLCRHVQSKCEPIMKHFRFPWPKELNCRTFPSSDVMCIQPESYDADLEDETLSSISQMKSSELNQLLPNLEPFLDMNKNDQNLEEFGRNRNLLSSLDNNYSMHSVNIPKFSIKCNQVEVPLVVDNLKIDIPCAPRCLADVYYRSAEKSLSDIWILVWSILCVVCSLLTLVTYFINRKRFLYPERPIIYISICYLGYSLGIISRLLIGRENVSCSEHVSQISSPNNVIKTLMVTNELGAVPQSLKFNKFLIIPGYEGTWCIITFIFLYYFNQASYLWWVMLSFSWFLSTTCKWVTEGIENLSSVLHMLAWSIPALKTMIILILHKIDADELTGICFVGYHDTTNLLIFVILPQMTYLLVGFILTSVGFFSLISVRTNLKHRAIHIYSDPQLQCLKPNGMATMQQDKSLSLEWSNIRRLDKLMIKMGIFSILYILPSICVIGSNWYEYAGQKLWSLSLKRLAETRNCLQYNGLNWSEAESCLYGLQFPSVEIKMLHMFMSMVVGITAGMWVWWNRKTVQSWTLFCTKRKQQQQLFVGKVKHGRRSVRACNAICSQNRNKHLELIDMKAFQSVNRQEASGCIAPSTPLNSHATDVQLTR